MSIAIIDYGMGNLGSVANAFAFFGARTKITSDPKVIAKAKAIVFPGVGAFGEAMAELKKRKLTDPILSSIREQKPFLGLCLGLQLLFSSSEESPGVKGLGILPGWVRKFRVKKKLKVPHMGWNQIEKVHSSSLMVHGKERRDVSMNHEPRTINQKSDLLKGVPDGAFMYFVHSFYAQLEEKKMVSAVTDYGIRFPSILSNGRRLWATQFHPEKSQKWGLKIVENFIHEVSLPHHLF